MTRTLLDFERRHGHHSSIRLLLERIKPWHILVAGWLLVFLYAFPGYMSTDSIVQLQQARSGIRTDWHPPLMALIWGLLDRIVSGPVLMLILQTGLFFAGLYKLLERGLPPRAAALTTCAIAIFPSVVTTMAVIWKDSQMAGFLLAGTAAALSPRRVWRITGWIFLGLATAMRHNAPAAILPLAIVIVWTSSARPGWQRAGISLLGSLGILLSATLVNGVLTVNREFPWYSSLALMDVSGTIRYSEPKTDEEMRYLLRDTHLVVDKDIYRTIRRSYDPRTWWWLTHGDARIWDPPMSKQQRLAIRRAWIDVVTADPAAYWHHRRRVFNEVLGISKQPPWSPVWTLFGDSPEQLASVSHNHSQSPYQRVLSQFFLERGNGPLFAVYWYFWLSWILLGVAVWRRHGLAVAFLASGLAYELSYFFLAPSPDFRYSHWMITCVVSVAAAFAVQFGLERWNRRRPRATAS